jgi:hypothetical protein
VSEAALFYNRLTSACHNIQILHDAAFSAYLVVSAEMALAFKISAAARLMPLNRLFRRPFFYTVSRYYHDYQ